MKRPVTIAAVQLPSAAPGRTPAARQRANFDQAGHWLNEAGKRGADIACLGEIFNAAGIDLHRTDLDVPRLVRHAEAEALRRLAPIARKHRLAIVAPLLAVLDGVVRNVAVVINEQGRLIGRYCKVHCIEHEKAFGVTPGDAWPVFEVKGARIGV